MNGVFYNGRSELASAVLLIIFFIGFIASIYVMYITRSYILQIVLPFILVIVICVMYKLLCRSTFSADEKSVVFHSNLKKYEYSYKHIINVKTKIVFTKGRYGKIPHMEIALSLKSGKVMRFYDSSIPSDKTDTIEHLEEFQENHQFTELTHYIIKMKGNF